MSLLTILEYPDPRLHTVASPVESYTPALSALIADMLETMYHANGVGLAATQVDVHQQVIVIDVSESRNEPWVIINPKVLWVSQESSKEDEGCLSVPGIYDGVLRPEKIKISAQDQHQQERIIEAEGLLARCIQHEMDHLNGKVFIERLSALKQQRIQTKVLKKNKPTSSLHN